MKHRAAFLVVSGLSLVLPVAYHATVAGETTSGSNVVVTPLAEAPAAPAVSLFHALDVNKDGYITADEAKRSKAVSAGWKALDSNGDNRLSAEEMGIAPN